MGQESKNSSGKNFISDNNLKNFKTRVNSKDVLAQFEDPTYLGFKLFFKGIDDPGHGGLLGAASNANSARYYLRQIGDEVRFKMLDTFVKMLKKINTEYPWYFQTIEGLDAAWTRDFSAPKVKGELTINCLESLDLRVTSLIDLYRKSAYDWNNTREVLTDNLRHFELDVMVYDKRSFRRDLQGDTINGRNPGDTSREEEVNNTFFGESEFERSSIMFNFSFVQFNLTSGSGLLGGISNSNPEAAQTDLKLEFEVVEESNLYRILTMLYNSDGQRFWYVKDYMNNIFSTLSGQGSGSFNKDLLGGSDILLSPSSREKSDKFNLQKELKKAKERAGKEIGNFTNDFIGNLQKDLEASVTNAIQSQLNSLFLGNVYGFTPSSIVNAGAAGAANRVTGAVTNRGKDNLGKIFDR